MNVSDAGYAQLRPPPEQVELALAGIESSASFRASARHRALLRYLVDQALADAPGTLKESVIAVEVFGRQPSRFNPQADSIVRVEARRLRSRLTAYYQGEGRGAAIRIELPVGSYLPLIASHGEQRHSEAATRRARDLVERGEHFLRQALSQGTLEQALTRFDEAQRESPTYAPAFVGLARAWLNLGLGWYREPQVAADHAGEALRRALALDPDDATAHALLGALQHQFEHDWPEAQRSFERAIALGPQQAFVHSAYGHHLSARGQVDLAERELMLARQLDPQYINSRMHMVNLRIVQGRLDQAELEIAAMRDIAPDTMAVVGMCGALAMFRRDAAAAIGHYERACEVAPEHPGCMAALAAAQGLSGQVELADATLARMHEKFADRFISPYMLAIVATRCGRLDQAFGLIEHCIRERDPNVMFMSHEPSFDDLRTDPRWTSVLALLNPAAPKPRRARAVALPTSTGAEPRTLRG